jgi:putative ABC transport system permease protein
MYFRMLRRAAMLRKGQAAAAIAAIAVAAAAATAMLNLYVDVQAKLRTEFRKFGANIVVEARPGQSFTREAIASLRSLLRDKGLTVPFAYAIAHTERDQPIVVAGVDFDLVRKLNPWWSVASWPTRSQQALVGVRAARLLSPEMKPFSLRYQGREIQLSAAGTVRTGAGEDSRVYISLADFKQWTGLPPSVVEIAANGSSEELTSLLQQLKDNLPDANVRPVRQITEAEANIMGKTRSTLISSAAFIVCTGALCILATLMGWVVDRRRDFAIMKALGASDRLIALFVSGEAAAMACVGTAMGFAAGVGMAAWIGRANFHAPVVPQLSTFPVVLGGSLLVTLLSTLLPLQLLRRIQPAMILRGE